MKFLLVFILSSCISTNQIAEDNNELFEFKTYPDDIREVLKAQYFDAQNMKDSGQLHWKKAALSTHRNLRKFALEKIAKFERSKITPSDNVLSKPPEATLGLGVIPSTDVFLTQAALNFCKRDPGVDWHIWRKNLSPEIKRYFSAVVSQCLGHNDEALQVFTDFFSDFAHSEIYDIYAYESLSRVIFLRRATGERETVAPYFLELMHFWTQKKFKDKMLTIDMKKAYHKLVEDGLGAARHRLLIQDTESAKFYAQLVIDTVKQGLTQTVDPDENFYEALNLAKVEAYHFLAFRIALENKQYTEAKALNAIALRVPGINLEWQTRLTTLSGMYEYLDKNNDAARTIWQNQLVATLDESIKPMLQFWITKTYLNQSRIDEAKFYGERLVRDFPLSFYSTFGMSRINSESRLKDVVYWTDSFQPKIPKGTPNLDFTRPVFERLESVNDLNQNPVQNIVYEDAEEEVSILCACTKIEAEPATLALAEFYTKISKNNRAIALITKLSKEKSFWQRNPAALPLYYPKSYLNEVKTSEKKSSVSSSTILSIIRQESSFEANATSPAAAVGLMQLLVSTAKGLSPDLGFQKNPVEQLKIPTLNIDLGSKYLAVLERTFNGNEFAAFAAYNAGDKTVKNWIDHRQFTDLMVFIEMIPYNETRLYVKNTLRNKIVYDFLLKDKHLVSEEKAYGKAF